MNARQLIIDCDPGIDDALALMLALRCPEFKVLGITTVSGNVPADEGAKNARQILRLLGREDCPVCIGAMHPLRRDYVDAKDTHGLDGLGEVFLPEIQCKEESDAHTFFVRTLTDLREKNEKADIIALGPLTNLQRLAEERPELFEAVRTVYTMGGSFRSHGNCSPVAEYNYWCDPDAAAMLYDAFAASHLTERGLLHMTGLDVTREIVLTREKIRRLKDENPRIGDFVERITAFYIAFHKMQEGIDGCVINDALTVLYARDESLCRGFDAHTKIVRDGIAIGQSIVDSQGIWREKANAHILTEVQTEAFWEDFFRILREGGEHEKA